MELHPDTIADRQDAYREAKTAAVCSAARQFGVLRLTGADRLDLLNRLTTNQLNKLTAGEGRQTVLTTEKGRIIDVLTVLVLDNELRVLTSAGKEREVSAWIKKYIVMDDVKVFDISGDYTFCEILGPAAASAVGGLTGGEILNVAMSHWKKYTLSGVSTLLFRAPSVAETSYIFCADKGVDLGDLFNDAGLQELPPETFEILRVESGTGVAGKELTADFNPLEAGLVHLVDFRKGCYIGQEVIARIDSYNKVQKRLMGFLTGGKVAEGSPIVFDGTEVGRITSVANSPDFGRIALGYIRGEAASPAATVSAGGVEAVISNLPFSQ